LSGALPRFIIDASVAIKWLFDDEEFAQEARSILLSFQIGMIDLLAPDHLYHEAINALCTGVRTRRIGVPDAEAAVRDFLQMGIPTVAGTNLFPVGFRYALQFDCAFYDGLYLALADQSGAPFLHADRRLRNTLGGRFANELWIGDYQPR
jgi:predicted nucleic acid-binding protein